MATETPAHACSKQVKALGIDAHNADQCQNSPARPLLRVLALNMCLLPAGINFSGSFLVDGDDRKVERLGMLLDLIEDYDIVLLNEVDGHNSLDAIAPLEAGASFVSCLC